MLAITGLFTALIILLAIALTFQVIGARRSESVSIGDGDSKLLATRMRGHANLIETAPLFLIGLAVLELNGANPIWLYIFGSLFIIGRVLHALAFVQNTNHSPFRKNGMVITMVAMLGVALYILGQLLFG